MEIKTIIFWVLIASVVIPGVIFGYKKLAGHPDSRAYFRRWGYPVWFMHLLGFSEIACSVLILFTATRVYAIAVFATIVAGAFYTHVRYKDPKKDVMKPIFVGTLLGLIFLFTLWK